MWFPSFEEQNWSKMLSHIINIRHPFWNARKQRAFEAETETQSLAPCRDTQMPSPLPNTKRAHRAVCKVGILWPTRRGLSEDTFPQVWQVLHFHALLKGKQESKTGIGKQVMSLKNYFQLRAERCPVYCDTNPYGPMHLVWSIPARKYNRTLFPPMTINLVCKHDLLLLQLNSFNLYLPPPRIPP